MIQFIKDHKGLSSAILVGAAAIGIFVIVWFEPQKLFFEDRVDEAVPSAVPALSPSAPDGPMAGVIPGPAQTPAELKILAAGEFRSLEHRSSGKALIVENPDGSRILRFENFRTSNGPDLVVYLSPVESTAGWRAYGEGFVDLGELKGNIGDQNYDIPAGIDLTKYKSAVVWCRRFAVGFAVAPIRQA